MFDLGRHNNAHRIWSQRHNLVKQELLLKIGGRIQLDPVDTGCTREIGEILEFLIDLSKFSTTCSRDLHTARTGTQMNSTFSSSVCSVPVEVPRYDYE
jgi:hypothetical protein